MKKYITLLCLAGTVLLQQEHTYAQPDCKLQLNLDSGQCYLPATVRANTDYGIYQIEWYKDGNLLHSYTREWDTTGAGVVVAGGNGPGDQLNQLMARGLEADEHDTLFIGDNRLNAVPKTNRVFKWYPGNATGTVVADGLNAPAASQCKPGDISLDQNKDLFIADEDNHRIIKWTPGATSGTNYAGTPGSTGSTLSQFNNINGIHYDTVSDNLYILDAFNFRLLEWPLNASSGNLLVSKLNSNPQYIDMDLEGNLYVSDFNNNRIIMFPPGSSTSVTVAGSPNGTGGNADSLLKAPEGVTVDGLKNLYISDYSNNRVQMWPFGSDKGITIGGGRGKGDALNQLNLPNSITQDRWGNVYVGDLNNHRVLMYAPLPIPDTLYTMEEGTYTVVVKTFSGCILTDSILVAPLVEHP